MKNLFTILYFVIIFNNTNAQSTELTNIISKKIDTISFKRHGFCYYRELILLKNAKFIKIENNYSDYGGGKNTLKKYYGKYKLNDSTLTLNPKKIEIETFVSSFEQKRTKKIIDYKSDSETMFSSIFKIKQNKNLEYLIPFKYGLTDLEFEKIIKSNLKGLFLKRRLDE